MNMRRSAREENRLSASQATHRNLQAIESKLDRLMSLVVWFAQQESLMLEALVAAVERNRTVDESAKALIVGIKAKLDELASRPSVDPAEIAALANELGASTDELAAAVSSGTPAEGE